MELEPGADGTPAADDAPAADAPAVAKVPAADATSAGATVGADVTADDVPFADAAVAVDTWPPSDRRARRRRAASARHGRPRWPRFSRCRLLCVDISFLTNQGGARCT